MLNLVSKLFTSIERLIIVALAVVILYLGYKVISKTSNETTITDSALLERKIKNVGKLVVTEGHFAEVITYEDQKSFIGDWVTFDKKALIVANAEVTVSYDLHLIDYTINETAKTVTIKNIPKAEVKIYPTLEFYDVNQSKFNPFDGEDYNKINKKVKADFQKKIAQSSIITNAENRLVSELSKILILTNSMGYTLVYKGKNLDEKTLSSSID